MKKSDITITAVFLALALGMNVAQAMELKDWKIEGSVTLDTAKTHAGKGASLKLAPGSRAVKTL